LFILRLIVIELETVVASLTILTEPLSFPFCGFAIQTMSGGGGDPAYQQGRGYPATGGASISDSSFNAADLSGSAGSLFSSGTSGVASGEGSECSGNLHQRLVAAGVAVGVSREQGVRDLRSIIQ
jgi:hypothetical protein